MAASAVLETASYSDIDLDRQFAVAEDLDVVTATQHAAGDEQFGSRRSDIELGQLMQVDRCVLGAERVVGSLSASGHALASGAGLETQATFASTT
jgi:hypothetical protein